MRAIAATKKVTATRIKRSTPVNLGQLIASIQPRKATTSPVKTQPNFGTNPPRARHPNTPRTGTNLGNAASRTSRRSLTVIALGVDEGGCDEGVDTRGKSTRPQRPRQPRVRTSGATILHWVNANLFGRERLGGRGRPRRPGPSGGAGRDRSRGVGNPFAPRADIDRGVNPDLSQRQCCVGGGHA